jgi:hypothetical protein
MKSNDGNVVHDTMIYALLDASFDLISFLE